MATLNRVQLIGNVTRDVEVRYSQAGTAVTDIGLAINEKRKNAAAQWEDAPPVFVDVTLWGRTAEVADQYLSKGSQVLIEGRLKLESWTEESGAKRSKLKVVCERLQMLGAPRDKANGQDEQSFEPVTTTVGAGVEADDVPF